MRARGFTLIELLIAMAITAFIGITTYGIFFAAMAADERNQQLASQLNELERAMAIIERDLLQAAPRSVINLYGEPEAAFTGQEESLYQDPEEYLLKLTRSGWHNPRQQQRSELARVAYRVEDNTLWRDSWWHIEPAGELTPVRTRLLDDITNVRLRYHRPVAQGQSSDTENQWSPEWPDRNAPGALGGDSLPWAVEMTMELEGWGEIRRLFLLP